MRKSNLFFIASILITALAVRLLGIASRPVWYDEAFSILFSEKGLSAMLYGTLAPTGIGSADIHPLGYYTVLWLWMKAFGQSLVAIRLLSILPGLISVLLIYLIGLEILTDRRTASLGALFAALAPFQAHYSQEIRMYSLMTMLVLLATYSYFRGARSDGWGWWIVLSISAALAQYTHHLAAFYLIALALLPVLQKNWKAFYKLALAGAGALILYAPWALHLPAQFSKVQNSYWVERPDVSKFFTLLLVYLTNTPLPQGLVLPALFLSLSIVVLGAIQTLRGYRQSGDPGGLWLLYLSFGPPLLLFLFSQWKPVYIERALLPSGAIFCLWLAWVLLRTNLARPVQIALYGLIAACFLLGVYQHVTYTDFPYGPYKELDASLRQRAGRDEIILHSNKMTMLPAMLFDRPLEQEYIGDVPGSRADTLAAATQEVLGIQANPDIHSAARDAAGIWFVIFKRELDEYETQGKRAHPYMTYLNSNYLLESQEEWGGLQVFHFVKGP